MNSEREKAYQILLHSYNCCLAIDMSYYSLYRHLGAIESSLIILNNIKLGEKLPRQKIKQKTLFGFFGYKEVDETYKQCILRLAKDFIGKSV